MYTYLLLAGLCLYSTTTASIVVSEEQPASQAQLYYLSMVGAYEHISGQTHRAKKTYQQVTDLAPESRALHHATLRLAFERNAYDDAIAQAPHVDVNNPSDEEAALNLGQAYLFSNRTHEALTILTQLQKKHPQNDRVDYFIALCHLQNSDTAHAHRTVDAALRNPTRASRRFLFHFLKAKLLISEGNTEKAEQHLEQALEQNPRFAKAIVIRGALLERKGQTQQAISAYKQYLKLNPDDKTIIQKIIALLFATKNFAEARTYLLRIPQDTADYFHDCALISFQLGEHDAAYTALQTALKKDPQHRKSQDLLTEVLLVQNNISELTNMYVSWITATPQSHALIARWYQLAGKKLPAETVIAGLRSAAEHTPTYKICFALGDLLHQFGYFEQARTWYKRTLKSPRVTSRSLLASKLHFQIACTFYHERAYHDANKHLEQALACSPIYPSVHNLIALIIVEAGGNISTAQEHINRALYAAPDNSAYLDTQRQLASVLV